MKQLFKLISDVFDAPYKEISIDSSMDTIKNWDSLNHMILAVALEEKYNISLAPEDIIEMVNVRIIREILKEKGIVLSNESK